MERHVRAIQDGGITLWLERMNSTTGYSVKFRINQPGAGANPVIAIQNATFETFEDAFEVVEEEALRSAVSKV